MVLRGQSSICILGVNPDKINLWQHYGEPRERQRHRRFSALRPAILYKKKFGGLQSRALVRSSPNRHMIYECATFREQDDAGRMGSSHGELERLQYVRLRDLYILSRYFSSEQAKYCCLALRSGNKKQASTTSVGRCMAIAVNSFNPVVPLLPGPQPETTTDHAPVIRLRTLVSLGVISRPPSP